MSISAQIQTAGAAGLLLPSTVENLAGWFAAGLPPWAVASVDELVAAGAWADLLVIDGNPLDDVTLLERHDSIRAVLKAGLFYKNALPS